MSVGSSVRWIRTVADRTVGFLRTGGNSAQGVVRDCDSSEPLRTVRARLAGCASSDTGQRRALPIGLRARYRGLGGGSTDERTCTYRRRRGNSDGGSAAAGPGRDHARRWLRSRSPDTPSSSRRCPGPTCPRSPRVRSGTSRRPATRFTSSARSPGDQGQRDHATCPGLTGWDINTGNLLPNFKPTITGGVLETVEATPDGTKLFVGGTFNTVNGVTQQKVAGLNPTTGAPLTTFDFTGNTNNPVTAARRDQLDPLRRRPVHPAQRRRPRPAWPRSTPPPARSTPSFNNNIVRRHRRQRRADASSSSS